MKIQRFVTGFALAILAGLVGGATSSVEATPPPPGCSASSRPACRYQSDLSFQAGETDVIVLTDPARDDYQVPLIVRYPIGAKSSRPVVIHHHGGGPGLNAMYRSSRFGRTLARAGYVVIHPARQYETDTTAYTQECADNGFDTVELCHYWVGQYLYGPQNTPFILDHLDDIEAAAPELEGMVSRSRFAVTGHSAGSAMVLANAGALRQWADDGTIYEEAVEGIEAFMISGPQGLQYAGFDSGFQPGSFGDLARPFMFFTGVGDIAGEPMETRLSAYYHAPPGEKYLSWDTKPGALHQTMALEDCTTGLQALHCAWMGSAATAFLDDKVRGRAAAHQWLHSTAYRTLTGGHIELHRR